MEAAGKFFNSFFRHGMDGDDVSIHGGGGEEDYESTVPEASMPSHAPSIASGFPGDLDGDEDDEDPIVIRPNWSIEDVHGHRWVDGDWEDQTRGTLEDQTRGDGGADQIHDTRDSENTDNPWISEKAGGVGIFCGNWGWSLESSRPGRSHEFRCQELPGPHSYHSGSRTGVAHAFTGTPSARYSKGKSTGDRIYPW